MNQPKREKPDDATVDEALARCYALLVAAGQRAQQERKREQEGKADGQRQILAQWLAAHREELENAPSQPALFDG